MDATVLSSGGKGHIYTPAVTGQLQDLLILLQECSTVSQHCGLSSRTVFLLFESSDIHALFCRCVYKEGERTGCVNGCACVSSTVLLLIIQILYECCFLVTERSWDDYTTI